MRAVYATHVQFDRTQRGEDVHRLVCDWMCEVVGAPDELHDTWEQLGHTQLELPRRGQDLELDVIKVGDDRLWQSAWRRPTPGERTLELITDVIVGDVDGVASASVVVGLERSQERLASLAYEIEAPSLIRRLVRQVPCRDADLRLSDRPRPLTVGGVPAFVEQVLFCGRRTRPVLVLTADRDGDLLLDAEQIARQLASLCHVYTVTDQQAVDALRDALGAELGVWGGAARLFWPDLLRFDDGRDHPLYTPAAVERWQGVPLAARLFRRINAVATASLTAPAAYTDLRRRARQTRIRPGDDIPGDWLEEFEQVLAERDELAEQLACEQARTASFGSAAHGRFNGRNGQRRDADGPPQTVTDAVEQAAGRCGHLVFLPSAYASAADSPFQRPELVLDALLKLEQLACRYARPDGAGGRLGDLARELGLDWAQQVSKVSVGRAPSGMYEAWWPEQGRKVPLGPHVRLGSGRGAGRIARIYLHLWDEPDDPRDRRFVIGHVGRILTNSTTG